MAFWDAETTFKTLIGLALAASAKYLFTKIKPGYIAIKKWLKVAEKVDELHKEAATLKSAQLAMHHINKDPIFLTNPKGEVTFVNAAWLNMTGIGDSRDAIGFGYLRAIPHEDLEYIKRQSDTLQEHPSPFSGKIRFKHIHTGDIYVTDCRSELIFNHEQKHVETIGRLYVIEVIKYKQS